MTRNEVSWLGPPIDVRPLLAPQQAAFVALLRQLDTPAWAGPTVCPGWSVQDVAAHVLADHLGRLSRHRDSFQSPHPHHGEAFPAFIDRINHEWVTAARRISPPLLIELLELVGAQTVAFWQTLDITQLGGRVSWAGPDPAPVWLDAARDFTEYWTHHQQIAEATGQPGLTHAHYLGPVLDTFLRALPHTLHDATAAAGTTLEFTVTGPAGGTWTCTRTQARWGLDREAYTSPEARVELDADTTTWRLCTRGISPEQAASKARTQGDRRLTTAALQIVSIIH
jgi:uncharacterized protein (TIGR03083 family)